MNLSYNPAMAKHRGIKNLSEAELLQTRICDLPLSLEEHFIIQQRIEKLYFELKAKGLRFRPHIWISDDWFSPDGHPGFAIPFYLFHPRLIQLEKKYIGFAEGNNQKDFMMLLRHECGHAIDNAFGLRRNKRRQQLFGLTKTKYPQSYSPCLNSRDFVFHLSDHYAQSHPDEDWAETFAVWLTPRSQWKKNYSGTKALKKLELVDEILNSKKGLPPTCLHRRKVDHFKSIKMTLGEYLQSKQRKYSFRTVNLYQKDIEKIFPVDDRRSSLTAVQFLKKNQKDLISHIANQTKHSDYTINGLYQEIIDLCRQKRLKLKTTEKETRELFTQIMVTQSKRDLIKSKYNKVLM